MQWQVTEQLWQFNRGQMMGVVCKYRQGKGTTRRWTGLEDSVCVCKRVCACVCTCMHACVRVCMRVYV